jgi:hypothetical protein
MKKLVVVFCELAFLFAAAGCGNQPSPTQQTAEEMRQSQIKRQQRMHQEAK